MSVAGDSPFRLGDWTVDPATGVVSRNQESTRLEPKVMDVLVCLARAQGRLVTKEELFESVWSGTAVSDDVLRRCIYNIRQALGDDSADPRYIRTWPRRGYTLERPVSRIEQNELPRAPREARGARARPRVALAALVLLTTTAAWAYFGSPAGIFAAGAEHSRGPEPPPPVSDPSTADDYYSLGAAHADRRGEEDFERAIELLLKAIELNPRHAPAHAELANVYALSVSGYYRDLARYDLAIEHATRALGHDPGNADAHKALGLAFAGKGWLTSSVREYERALELAPGYQAVMNNLALIHVRRGDLDRAILLQRALHSTGPDRALYLNNLGRSYRLLGDFDAARRNLSLALEITPGYAHASSNLALIELFEGDADAALRLMRRAVELNATDPVLLANAGYVELVAGNPETARAMFRESVERSADGINGRARMGVAYIDHRAGDFEAADEVLDGFVAWAESAGRHRREDTAVPYYLAMVHAIRGERGSALDQLERAIELGFVEPHLLAVDPYFDNVRDEPRFHALLSELRQRAAKMRSRVEAGGS